MYFNVQIVEKETECKPSKPRELCEIELKAYSLLLLGGGSCYFPTARLQKPFFSKSDVQKASTKKISYKKLIVCQPICNYSSILICDENEEIFLNAAN
jgi:hypothetical protein